MLITGYDPVTFRRKSTVASAKSVIFNKRLYDLGSFELTLKKCDFEVGDLILYGNFSGRINRIVRDLKQNTKVYGYDLKSLLYQRYFNSDVIYTNKTAEYIIKNIAEIFLFTGSRKITGLSITDDSGTGEIISEYKFEKGGRVSEKLKEFCQQYCTGYDIAFNEESIVFDVIKEQENSDVIFGRCFGNVEELTYTYGNYDFANVVYCPNEEQNANDDKISGIQRFEGYISNADELNTYKEKHGMEETIKAEANGKYKYGVDYDLGDVVTVVFDDLSTVKTITEVEIVIEPNRYREIPTFGTEKENPIKKLIRSE